MTNNDMVPLTNVERVAGTDVYAVREPYQTHVTISVADLEVLAHGVEFARRVATDLAILFNDPAMERTQTRIREAQKEAMRLVGLARRPR